MGEGRACPAGTGALHARNGSCAARLFLPAIPRHAHTGRRRAALRNRAVPDDLGRSRYLRRVGQPPGCPAAEPDRPGHLQGGEGDVHPLPGRWGGGQPAAHLPRTFRRHDDAIGTLSRFFRMPAGPAQRAVPRSGHGAGRLGRLRARAGRLAGDGRAVHARPLDPRSVARAASASSESSWPRRWAPTLARAPAPPRSRSASWSPRRASPSLTVR